MSQRADAVINTMVAVGNDLLGLVDTSRVAKDIVNAYKIRQGNVPVDEGPKDNTPPGNPPQNPQ